MSHKLVKVKEESLSYLNQIKAFLLHKNLKATNEEAVAYSLKYTNEGLENEK